MPLTTLLLAALLQSTVSLPAITITPGSDGDFVEQADPFDEGLLEQVRLFGAERAAQICGTRGINWGTVSYSARAVGNSGAMVDDFRLPFRCRDADAAQYPPVPADWTAAPADESAARATFEAFFKTRDAGKLEASFAMFEPGAGGDFGAWKTAQEHTIAMLAKGGTRRVTKVDWLLNPQLAPHPGAFVRIAFEGEYGGLPVYCGALMLYRAAPDRYLVVGMREHVLPEGEAPDAQRVAEYREQRCV